MNTGRLLLLLSLSAILSACCANKADVSNLQTQIDGLKAELAGVKAMAEEALNTSSQVKQLENEIKVLQKTVDELKSKLSATSPPEQIKRRR